MDLHQHPAIKIPPDKKERTAATRLLQTSTASNTPTALTVPGVECINPKDGLQDGLNSIAFIKPAQRPQLLPPFWKPQA
jgi:hypothetical protein